MEEKKNRKKHKKRILIVEIIILLCLIGCGYLYSVMTAKRPVAPAVLQKKQLTESVSAQNVDKENSDIKLEPVYKTILLVGLDVRNQEQMDYSNSDTMIIASVDEVSGNIRMASIYRDTLLNINTRQGDPMIESIKNGGDGSTDIGRYDKANAAYANGGIEQLKGMIDNNLDIPIDEYFIVNFSAVADVVDALGGIDVWMTKQEVIHMNNYCVETSNVTGKEYTPIEPDEEAHDYHLNGVQAVSYARIRYTKGNDMKRTQRQRVVINKILEEARKQPFAAIQTAITDILPNCRTSMSISDILSYAANMEYYQIEKTTGFPFEHIERHCSPNGEMIDPVVPVTLRNNVKELHQFFYEDDEYVPTTLTEWISKGIEEITGLTEYDMEAAKENGVIENAGGEADLVDEKEYKAD